jgi:hypothetical protein
MIPTHTIPSLSGTFSIPARLALNPKKPKEPSSPSRSDTRIERQLHNEKNQGQRTTCYKSNSRTLCFMLRETVQVMPTHICKP